MNRQDQARNVSWPLRRRLANLMGEQTLSALPLPSITASQSSDVTDHHEDRIETSQSSIASSDDQENQRSGLQPDAVKAITAAEIERPQTATAPSLATIKFLFTRQHLVVLAVVVGLGLVVACWAVLSAKAVRVKAPIKPSVVATSAATPAASATPTPNVAVVHVIGAVAKPGLVTLQPGARVADAIAQAGGLAAGAQLGELNLAAVVSDSCQIVVGSTQKPQSEMRNGEQQNPGSAVTGTDGHSAQSGTKVDLNIATVAQLDTLPGIGPVTAQRIIDFRTKHGRLSRVEELQEVEGIGAKTLDRLKQYVRV